MTDATGMRITNGALILAAVALAFPVAGCAQSDQGTSSNQILAVASPAESTSALPALTQLKVVPRNDGMTISWRSDSEAMIDKIRVWIDTDPPVELEPDATRFAVADLEPNSWHQVRVAAVNESGQGPAAFEEITLPSAEGEKLEEGP